MAHTMKERLKNGEVLVGPILTLASPEIAEIMALVGFDYVWIDGEHSPIDFYQMQLMVQAVGGRCPSLIRVPENRDVWFKKILDIGCDGIVVPQVKTAEEAERAVRSCRYPPGTRGVGASRAQGYGLSFRDYIERADEELTLVIQIEHFEGVKNIASIVEIPGIAAILVGTADLSASYGLLGQYDHPEFQEAVRNVKRHCAEAGVPAGIFAADTETANRYIKDGFQLIALGVDSFYLWSSAKASLEDIDRRS